MLAPSMSYATGMDVLQRTRSLNHLKKMHARNLPMSAAFQQLTAGHVSSLSDSEGEWVPPETSDLSLLRLPARGRVGAESDSGGEADDEDDASLRAAADVQRPRAEGSSWADRLRG